MALKCLQTAIPDVRIIVPEVFRDPRGFFVETFHAAKYRDFGITDAFVQDNRSHSTRGILRGLHYQLNHPQAKLVMAVQGSVFDVAVDIRRGSPTFGRWIGQILSEENGYQLYIPKGFAHGFCVLSESADVWYKCSDFYDPKDDRGILWSDPAIGIDWPAGERILSAKDSRHPPLAEAAIFLPAGTA